MNNLLIATALAFACSTAAYAGDTYVNGYTRSNGTYVEGYHRSTADSTVTNNYSYSGNINPSSGEEGSNHYVHDTTSPYFNGTPNSQGTYGHASGYSENNNSGN